MHSKAPLVALHSSRSCACCIVQLYPVWEEQLWRWMWILKMRLQEPFSSSASCRNLCNVIVRCLLTMSQVLPCASLKQHIIFLGPSLAGLRQGQYVLPFADEWIASALMKALLLSACIWVWYRELRRKSCNVGITKPLTRLGLMGMSCS